MDAISLRGARTHNLDGVDLDLQRGTWIAVTGVSGSGKTSLVLDTLVREGQRRLLSGFSARARQVLGKLGRAELDALTGLPASVAVAQRTLTAHPRSTVGTLTGTLDWLRLLFAREAVEPGGEALTRGHFSFNHPTGACEACRGLGIEDFVDPALLVADPTRSIRDGALKPTLKNGYTVYSQVTLEVMDRICEAHGFDVHTPWQDLTDDQRDVILYGTKALKVPFGKHSIASRMKWSGITARPREEGYYRGLIPVITETLARNRNDNVLRFVRSVPCSVCAGSRLGRPGREAVLGGHTLPALLAVPVRELGARLDALPSSAVWDAIRPSLRPRIDRMVQLSLGHLSLDRPSATLSGGEGQRLRIAAQVTGGMSGLLVALDEPTLGLHPGAQPGLRAVLEDLRAVGNTVVTVEHDPDLVRVVDRVVHLGPGAGPHGGRVVADGPPTADPLGPPPVPKPDVRTGHGALVLEGATLHGLRDATLRVPLGTLAVVLGPSGAGKSSLVFGTLLPALTGDRGGPYTQLAGVPEDVRVEALDASPLGRTPRSTPATWTGLFDRVRRRFAAADAAKALGFTASRFSYNHEAGRCPTCEGLGVERIGLHLLEDLERPCPACDGGRYAPETLRVRCWGATIAEVLQWTVEEAAQRWAGEPKLSPLVEALQALGLGYLELGQSCTTLSRGEGQRIKLATLVGTVGARTTPMLVLLDEPDRGLHPDDVRRLIAALDALVDAGHTVLAISHHRHLWAAADHRIGVEDGAVTADPSLSFERLSTVSARRPPAPQPDVIRLRGVRTNNLTGVDIDLPHRQLVGIVGVSGSGKSSLALHTLAAEGWRRLAESLPFEARRWLRRLPRPELDEATGLTPTVLLGQDRGDPGPRSTVATQTEVGPLLRLLFSRAGTVDGAPCELRAEHFSPRRALGACPECAGRGTVRRCDPDRLVSHPGRVLGEGVLSGTKLGRFLEEPDGQYLATLKAAVGADGDLSRPWSELSEAVRRVALWGAGEQTFSVTWRFKRGKRSGEHSFEGPWLGLCALAEQEAAARSGRKDAAAWAEPLVDRCCPECEGSGLGAAARAVRIGSLSLPDVLELPVAEVWEALSAPSLDARQAAVLGAVGPELRARLCDLVALGLGHLTPSRRASTLSGGELQRVRLAAVLRSGLTGLTVVLDEPGAGLHEHDLRGVLARLRAMVDAGNTVVIVTHRPTLIRACDHLVELGPGSGSDGGRVVNVGRPAELSEGLVARGETSVGNPERTSVAEVAVRVEGIAVRTLHDLDLALPASGLVAVTGVSGAGKSTLLFEVLEPSARAGRAVHCASVEGLEHFVDVRTARGQDRRHAVLDVLDLVPALKGHFANAAKDAGVPKRALSWRSPAGRCETCRGSGRQRVSLDALADLQLPCPACGGRRYRPEVLAVQTDDGLGVDDVLRVPASELVPRLGDGRLRAACEALDAVGLGAIALGRRRAELSPGEAQRVLVAGMLLASDAPALVLLDEPATGLHERELPRLAAALHVLVERGDLVVVAEHRRTLVAAADVEVALPSPTRRGG